MALMYGAECALMQVAVIADTQRRHQASMPFTSFFTGFRAD